MCTYVITKVFEHVLYIYNLFIGMCVSVCNLFVHTICLFLFLRDYRSRLLLKT